MKSRKAKTGLKNTISKVLGAKATDNLINLVKGKNRFSEKEEVVKSRIAFYSSFLQPGDLVFDVGSNMGNRIRPFLAMGLKVVAVEPQSQCVSYLKKTFGDQISIEQKGAGAKEEVKTMYIADEQNYLSSFSKDWIDKMKAERFSDVNWDKSEQIEITTLDSLIKKYGTPQLIKIDVEGFEPEVLSGLNTSVKMISFEYAVPENTQGLLSCLSRIAAINVAYRCNYSVGESMTFASNDWMTIAEMEAFVNTPKFQQTSFGDVYVRAY